MSKSFPIYTHFNTGEISDRLKGRVDLDKYKHGCETLENFTVLPEGGVDYRGGFHYVADVKTQSAVTRLVPFQFNDDQSYIIELGNLYARFYKDNGRIESPPGTPIEIVTTYVTADLFELHFAQSADTMYIAHRSYPPRKITRTSHTAWTIADVSFVDNPPSFVSVADAVVNGNFSSGLTSWSDINVSASSDITATGGAVLLDHAGAAAKIEQVVTVTAGVAYDLQFHFVEHTHGTSTNRKLRVGAGVSSGATGDLAEQIVSPGVHEFSVTPTNSTLYLHFRNADQGVATLSNVTMRRTSGGTIDTDTYPGAVTFFQQRLFWAGSNKNPQTFWGSQTGSYENMDPAAADADHGVQFAIAANSLDTIQFLASSRDLLIGTYGGEHTANGGVDNAITPSSINVTLQSAFGAGKVMPQNAGNALLFATRAGKKLRELVFNFDVDGFKAPDLTLLAQHITNDGITQMAYKQDTDSILFCTTSSGELIGMTYLPDQNVIAWHRHPIAGTRATVESVAVIPDPSKSEDQLWVISQHEVNGSIVRQVGYLDNDIYVDHGVELNTAITISGATAADPVVITATGHGLSDGDEVLIEDVIGMTELNKIVYTVNNQTTNTFELQSIDQTPADIDGSAYTAYSSGGNAYLGVTTLSGLTHLEGEDIWIVDRDTILYEGATVSSGAVTVPDSQKVFRAYAGLWYEGVLKPVRPEFGSPQGMTQGKRKRWNKLGLRIESTLGGTVNGDDIEYLIDGQTVDTGIDLYSGDKMMDTTDWDPDGFIIIRQNKPLPMTVTSVFGDLEVGEIYGSDD